jgi:hypothetical protein
VEAKGGEISDSETRTLMAGSTLTLGWSFITITWSLLMKPSYMSPSLHEVARVWMLVLCNRNSWTVSLGCKQASPSRRWYTVAPACSRDLLAVINGLNCHPVPRCKAVQGSTIPAKNVAFCSTDGNRTTGWDCFIYGGEGGILTQPLGRS